jgi:cobalt-zinc-cadmium efflux system outer membrane protein
LTAVAREIAAARAGVRSARALTNPTLVFVPSLFGTGSDEEILFQQPLELNGTRSARTGVAQAQLRQTQAEAVVELRTLVSETRAAYYDLARAQELLTLGQELLRTAEEFSRGVRRQAEEGLRPGIDQTQAGIEVARARQQMTLAEGQVRAAQAALNTLMGQPASEPVAVVTPIPFSPGSVDTQALVQQALAARAEITAQEARGQGFREEARLARAQGRPDLAPQFRTESVLRSPRQPGIGIGISLPLLDWGGRRNRIRQAEASARAQEARVAVAQAQVRREVEQAVARQRAAESIVRDYQGGVLDQARRLLEGSLRALQIGAPGASILTALEAQRTYRGVLTEYTNALASAAQARAELERATGAVPADLLPQAATTDGRTRATPR